MKPVLRRLCVAVCLALVAGTSCAEAIALKDLGRFDGWRENSLIGYGLVVGLSGSGDSARSGATRQTLQNVLSRLGTQVPEEDLVSRNVAVVIAVANLPASANPGDRIAVTVSSAGDARSLAGGTLLMTPLLGPDRRPYALAQGPLLTGGYSFQSELESRQRNYPTTARLEGGATVEAPVDAVLLNERGEVGFLLNDPNFATADRVAAAINADLGADLATARNADEVRIRYSGTQSELVRFLAQVQAISIEPDRTARIVINERTGTIVAGGGARISSTVISQGDVRVTVTSESSASQPAFIGGFANDVASLVVTNTDLSVVDDDGDVVASFPDTTVADLVQGLSKAKVSTRDMISILQAMKAAGALHAEIIVQ
jgi:flagellar P-ring protein FlgI